MRSPRPPLSFFLVLVLILLAACGATQTATTPSTSSPSASAAAPPQTATASSSDAPPSTWLELDGARMLVTTTRATAVHHHHDDRDASALPLLVVLPWSRSTPAELLAEVGYLDVDAPARIVAIEGFEPDGDGFSWWRRARPAPTPADPDHDAELISLLTDRAARLAKLLATVQAHFGSPTPPVVSGVSQGGDLSIALAVHHPSSISAALPIAARFPAPLWPERATTDHTTHPPLDAFHGADDPIAPLAALERAFTALRTAGLPAQLHAFPGVKHEIAPTLRTAILSCAASRLRGSHQPCATQIKN